jgi:hypothetical protein
MSELIKMGCTVADVYHRYHDIHGTLFGVSYFRRMLNELRGRPQEHYTEFSRVLNGLQDELGTLEAEISEPVDNKPVTGADRQLRNALLEYTRHLNRAVDGLEHICRNLEQDDAAYREPQADGRSRFTADKLEYDQLLSELERRGTRLEKLFANY